MGAAVIVAIPRQDEAVWKISSEKIPHLTLLYLGEDMAGDRAARIAQFLQHAAKNLGPFGMDVDYRGELGEDRADVLFFKKSWSKEIENFRANLLGNPDVKLAYNSTEQHPKWLPHLTLGYPETPAHPDERENPYLGYISFDRVALWTEDFDGPTFRLEDQYGEAEVPMYHSVDDFLSGYGVKALAHATREDTPLRVAPALSRFERTERNSTKNRGDFDESKVKRDGHGKFAKKESRLSKEEVDKKLDVMWGDKNILQMNVVDAAKDALEETITTIAKKHGLPPEKPIDESPEAWKEAKPAILEILNYTASRLAVSPSGTKMAKFSYTKDNHIKVDIVPHYGPNPNADYARPERIRLQRLARETTDGPTMRYNPDATLDPSQIEIRHGGLDNLEDFLAHYGIKGMRWGIRRSEAQLARLNKKQAELDKKQAELSRAAAKIGAHKVEVDVVVDKNGNVVSQTPVKDAHPSDDAVKFVENRLKSPAELSTKEIRELTERVKVMQDYEKYFGEGPHADLKREVDRLNLEKDYRQLKAQMASPSKAKVAARTVGNLAKTAGDSFIAFKKLDKATGGMLSKELAVAVGLQTAYKAKHRAAPPTKSKKKKK